MPVEHKFMSGPDAPPLPDAPDRREQEIRINAIIERMEKNESYLDALENYAATQSERIQDIIERFVIPV